MGAVNEDDPIMRLFSPSFPDSLANSDADEGFCRDENEDAGKNKSLRGARVDQSVVSRGGKRHTEAFGASSEFTCALKIVCSTYKDVSLSRSKQTSA